MTVVIVSVSNHEDPPEMDYPTGSANRFGLNEPAFERQVWLVASQQEPEASGSGVAL